jgi:hypothetical protein
MFRELHDAPRGVGRVIHPIATCKKSFVYTILTIGVIAHMVMFVLPPVAADEFNETGWKIIIYYNTAFVIYAVASVYGATKLSRAYTRWHNSNGALAIVWLAKGVQVCGVVLLSIQLTLGDNMRIMLYTIVAYDLLMIECVVTNILVYYT